MLPTQHPLTLTSKQLRRSKVRLENYRHMNPHNPEVVNGTMSEIIKDITAAYNKIPKELRDEANV